MTISVAPLPQFLRERKLFVDEKTAGILEAVLGSSRRAIMFRGQAGTGKTSLASHIAEYLNAEFIFFQCTYGTGEDELLYKYVPSETTKSGIKVSLGPVPLALKLSRTKTVVLLLDEFDKTRPSADALLLDVLQNCRIALYIDDTEKIIQGNSQNITVILTSNDVREFSEPLLRRLTVITLKPLQTRAVYDLLIEKFDEKIAVLLAQIYDDTIKAGLRKPATVQELVQLGEVLTRNQELSLSDLLRSFVIKYDDDLSRYMQYIQQRKPYEFSSHSSSSSSNSSLEQAYAAQEQVIIPTEEVQEQSETSVKQVLAKLTVVKPTKTIERSEVMQEQTVTAKIEDADFEGYTAIVKTFLPEPSDDPTRLGKFRAVVDEMKQYITATEPLTLKELIELSKTPRMKGEFYVEDDIVVNDEMIRKLVKSSDVSKVKYWTRDEIAFECSKDKVLLVTERAVGSAKKVQIKMYTTEFAALKCFINVMDDKYKFANGLLQKTDVKDVKAAIEVIEMVSARSPETVFVIGQNNYDLAYGETGAVIVGYRLADRIKSVTSLQSFTAERLLEILKRFDGDQ